MNTNSSPWARLGSKVALTGLAAIAFAGGGCRSSCRPRLIEVSLCGPQHGHCQCQTRVPAPAAAEPCDARPAAGPPQVARNSVLNTSPPESVRSPEPAVVRKQPESSSRRIHAEEASGAGTSESLASIAGRHARVADPDLIRQLEVPSSLTVPPAASAGAAEAETPASAQGDDGSDTASELLARPPVVAETPPAVAPEAPIEAETVARGIAEGAALSSSLTDDAGSGDESAAAGQETQPVQCRPLVDATTAAGADLPIVLRAIAPDSVITPPAHAGQRTVQRPNGTGVQAQPAAFRRPAAEPAPASGSRPLEPQFIPPPVFRPLPFTDPDPAILRATCGNGAAAGGETAGTAHDPVSNTASIRDAAPAGSPQR